MSSLEHARQAIAMARALRAPDRDAVRRIVALAEPHLPEPLPALGPYSLTVLAGQPPLTARERLAVVLEPAAVRVFLPALRDGMLRGVDGRAPASGAPDAIACAEAFRALGDWLGVRRPHPMARMLGLEISRAILARATACSAHVTGLLEQPDYPDLAALSMDLLHLEGLRWLAEVLADTRAQAAIARLSRRLARVTLTRARATMQAFLDQRDLPSLFDNAGVVSQVDNLVVVTLRILDALAEEEEERTAFVPTVDEEALDGFLGTLAELGEALLRMLAAAAGQPGRESFFSSLLRQTECVLRIAAHLDHAARPQRLDDIERRLRTRLTALSAELADRLGEAAAAADADRVPLDRRLAQAGELCAAFERLGLQAEAGTLAVRLRAVRQRITR
ncbi:hypothetical protein [Azospirillum sp. A39]|uniref:hypothetical protein n=1 Tax=Azospirillum sp. A39 TaxID=3462279 RepID=UPI0040467A44